MKLNVDDLRRAIAAAPSFEADLNSTIVPQISSPTEPNADLASAAASIAYMVLFFIGVSGNLLTIVIVLLWLDIRSTTNIFVANLAVADLCYTAWIPVLVDKLTAGFWRWGDQACKLYYTTNMVNQFGSVQFLAVLSIDRYIAICHPVLSRSVRNPRNAVLIALTCWLIVSILGLPVILYAKRIEKDLMFLNVSMLAEFFGNVSVEAIEHDLNYGEQPEKEVQCVIEMPTNVGFDCHQIYTITSFILAFLIPMLAMWLLYMITSVRLASHENRMRSLSKHSLRRRSRKGKRAAYTVIGLVAFYTVCWTPYWSLQMLLEYWKAKDQLAAHKLLIPALAFTTYTFPYLNAALNPFIFLFISSEVDTAMRSGPRCLRKPTAHSLTVASSMIKAGRRDTFLHCTVPPPPKLRAASAPLLVSSATTKRLPVAEPDATAVL